MKIYNRKRAEINTHAHAHTSIKSKKRPDQDSNSHERKEIRIPYQTKINLLLFTYRATEKVE